MTRFGNIIIKNSAVIEKRFRFLNFTNSALTVIALMANFGFLFYIFSSFNFFNSRISILYPIIHFAPSLLKLLFLFHCDLLSDIKDKHIGVYPKNRIVNLWDTMVKENFDEKEEIPSIYIIKDSGPNAFAINSLILNSFKNLNSISISRELFKFLSINELRSVIAHEIAHFKKYIPITIRIPSISFLFGILGSYILTAILIPIIGNYDFFIYLTCFLLIRYIWSRPSNLFKQDIEFLSDLYAAEKYGKLHMVNALIKIYQLDNMDMILNQEISKYIINGNHLQTKDLEKLNKAIKRKLNKKIHDEDLMLKQIKSHLKKMKHKKKKKLPKETIEKRDQTLNKYLKSMSLMNNYKTICWNEVDHNIKDGRIDAVEYEGLIETLVNNPELQLFRTIADNIQKMKFESHPTLRERILFMDHNCSKLEQEADLV